MPENRHDLRQAYPLPAYNFRVSIDSVTMSFAEVTGVNVAFEHLSYRHGLSYSEGEQITTFDFDAFQPITLKRGTILSAEPLYLHDWLRARQERAVAVSLCDETGTPVLTWQIARAVPTKLEAPSFSADSNEPAIQSLELQTRGISLVAP